MSGRANEMPRHSATSVSHVRELNMKLVNTTNNSNHIVIIVSYVGLSFASYLGDLPRDAFLYVMFNGMETALLPVKNI